MWFAQCHNKLIVGLGPESRLSSSVLVSLAPGKYMILLLFVLRVFAVVVVISLIISQSGE